MHKILENWFFWLLLIVCLRLPFAFFGEPATAPEQNTIHLLLQTAIHSPRSEIRSTAFTALQKSARHYPQYRDDIIAELTKQAAQRSDQLPEIKASLAAIEKDPFYQLEKAVANISIPLIFYLEPLFFFLPLFAAFIATICLPFFLNYFVSHRAVDKLLGKRRKKLFLVLNLGLWSGLLYTFYLHGEMIWPLHIILVIASLFILQRMYASRLMTILLELSTRRAAMLFIALTVVLLASFIPYPAQFLQKQMQAKIPEQKLIESLQALTPEHADQAIPLLLKILNKPTNYSEALICEILSTFGRIGDEKALPIVNNYLNSRQRNIKKAALDAVLQILQDKKQEQDK